VRSATLSNDVVIVAEYNVWGLDLSGSLQGAGGVGGLLAVTVAGGDDPGHYVAAYDANGNVTDYVDATGAIVAHREYGPFGETTALSGPMQNAFTHWWSTKPWDPITGFSEYQFRMYSPEMGRWLSRDPIGELGGLNVNSFALNDPVCLLDTDGRFLFPFEPAKVGVLLGTALNCYREYQTKGGKTLADTARDIYYNKVRPQYTCCHKGKVVDNMDVYDNPDDGLRTSHQVLHRTTGCVLKERGFSTSCMLLLNLLYEVKTINKELIERMRLDANDPLKRNVADWIEDTTRDFGAVVEGFWKGPPCDGNRFVPSECTRKSGNAP
jgi:RHS repeat-associated protein